MSLSEKEAREENAELIKDFVLWLENKPLSKKTIEKYASNIDFYINEYLIYDGEEIERAKDGYHGGTIDVFFDYWFPKKALWASKASTKENITSLKKFYSFMLETNSITSENYNELLETFKDYKFNWLDNMDE